VNNRATDRRRVLITGSGGQLASELMAELPSSWCAHTRSHRELDVTDAVSVLNAIESEQPDLIVNAAGFTKVDDAESRPEDAFAVNTNGVENLADACARVGSRLIHVSTDYVFDGEKRQAYKPSDLPAPINAYGASKLAGEQAVQRLLPSRALIVRTAWLYSRQQPNFVLTMLDLINRRETVGVVSDQFGSPTWAKGLARVIWRAADEDSLSGVLHWTDGGSAAWYEFALAVEEEGRDLGLVSKTGPVVKPVTTAEYPTRARRPVYTALDSASTCARLGVQQRPWRAQLRSMLETLA
jgi:dTDP-4-dehydrorhamnose reductase